MENLEKKYRFRIKIICLFLLLFVKGYSQIPSLVELQLVKDRSELITPSVKEYINKKENECTSDIYYYYVSFYEPDKFYISRLFDDYNNFLLTCDAYFIVDNKIIFLTKNDNNIFVSTGRYKTFEFIKTDNQMIIPLGYESDSWYFRIQNDTVIIDHKKKCNG